MNNEYDDEEHPSSINYNKKIVVFGWEANRVTVIGEDAARTIKGTYNQEKIEGKKKRTLR
jgi:hypothetical protein